MRCRALPALLLLLAPLGCGTFFVYPGSTSGTTSSSGDYVYVANATTATLAGYNVGSGALTAISGTPFSLGFTPKAVVVNPADSILFVSGYSSAGTGLIYAFAIGSGGALTTLNNGSAVSTGVYEVAMSVSPDGQWLLGLDGNNTTIDEFSINSSSGLLTGPTLTAYANPGTNAVNASAIQFAPGGALVFVALGTAGDLVYSFNTASTSGLLTQTQLLALTTATSDNALAVSPNGNFLFVARSGVNGGLAVYGIGTSGALTAVSGSPFTAGTQPFSVAVNTAGSDVYVANRSDSTISGFSIASTGVLTKLGSSPYGSGSAVNALLADKSGSYLLATAGGGSPDLTLYSFDSSGNLDSAATTATGTDPAGATAIAGTH